ncbi:MoaD/ThiS family protein [Neobacillus sp. PS3-34]|uniref:MoaD/ThiS family protein n=1 Tax=Neobacillus sp. PS3-34 TaxID=3070678 RepID=UPI0035A63C2E
MNKVMFFAHLRDSVGEEIVNMEAAGKTIAQLKTEIAEKSPENGNSDGGHQ